MQHEGFALHPGAPSISREVVGANRGQVLVTTMRSAPFRLRVVLYPRPWTKNNPLCSIGRQKAIDDGFAWNQNPRTRSEALCLARHPKEKGASKPRPLPRRRPRRTTEQHPARRSLAGARVEVLLLLSRARGLRLVVSWEAET